jgi:hypothetical protein
MNMECADDDAGSIIFPFDVHSLTYGLLDKCTAVSQDIITIALQRTLPIRQRLLLPTRLLTLRMHLFVLLELGSRRTRR